MPVWRVTGRDGGEVYVNAPTKVAAEACGTENGLKEPLALEVEAAPPRANVIGVRPPKRRRPPEIFWQVFFAVVLGQLTAMVLARILFRP